jgi:hypothetical protein
MSSVTNPRGRLPARVYWFRRGLVLATAAALVFGFAQLLGGGGGADPGAGRATLAGATQSTTPSPRPVGPAVVPSLTPGPVKAGKKAGGKQTTPSPRSTPLASPDGPCAPNEISVAPRITGAKAGGAVRIDLLLTATRPACTFDASAKSVALRITSGSDRIWSSQDCPRAVTKQSVVVRSAVPAVVPVTWDGRRSDGSCGVSNAWARAGYYHAVAAVIGSVPADVQFALAVPTPKVVTKTTHPKPQKQKAKKGANKGAEDAATSKNGDNAVHLD